MRTLKNAIKSGLGRRPIETVHGQKDSAWYDRAFQENPHWCEHYTKSKYYPIWSVIADRVARRGVRSVLDVGCGSGQLAQLLSNKGLENYCGIDFSEERIAQARLVCPQYAFRNEDAFQSDAFDAIDYDCLITTEFLEHVERDLDAIQRVRAGVFFLGTVPNFPFVSHVRHFREEDEVRQRYAKFFDDFRIDAFYGNDKGQTFFIIEGVKR